MAPSVFVAIIEYVFPLLNCHVLPQQQCLHMLITFFLSLLDYSAVTFVHGITLKSAAWQPDFHETSANSRLSLASP
jgi:hypothetical protein